MKKQTLLTQAVILAAGESSRCVPFNARGTHKSTNTVMGSPIIFQTIVSLQKAGITEVLIVRSPNDSHIESVCFQNRLPGMSISFHIQKEALGMGNALLSLQKKLRPQFLLVNPQQVNSDQHLQQLNISPDSFDENALILFSQKTNNPQKYGMLQLEGTRVTGVVEKPQDTEKVSNQRILGMYILTRKFIKHMSTMTTTEYQFEDALNDFSKTNSVTAVESFQPGITLKYAWDFFSISQYLFERLGLKKPAIHPSATVHPTALITGPVVIEAGAQIYEYALIQGPCYIGKNVVVGSYCKVRSGAVLEENVELQNNVEVKHSLIGKNTHIHSGFVGDSILGENSRIGALFATANRRLDRQNIFIPIKGKKVDTRTSSFGALIGDNVKIGVHCGTNPGTVISSDTTIYPGTIISNPKLQ